MKTTIAVAVSGGIDSLYAAYVLKKKPYRVFGLHFVTGYESAPLKTTDISDQIGMPVHLVDLRREFKSKVIDYFTRSYRQGRTPNPCLVCNPMIKYGVLLKAAQQKGADKLATGHYARIHKDHRQRCHLLKGVDSRKDQSYFLAFLSHEQLSLAEFPLGSLTKTEVRKRAADTGLKPLATGESQDVCFIRNTTCGDFLASRSGITADSGDIVDLNGNIIGRHRGLHRFTVGQRRGINCPAAEPYYVIRLNAESNQLVVGNAKSLESTYCQVAGINWIQPLPSKPLRAEVQIRYRHRAAPAVVTPLGDRRAAITFDQPQSAVTPGQGAVFYHQNEVLAGGWIEN